MAKGLQYKFLLCGFINYWEHLNGFKLLQTCKHNVCTYISYIFVLIVLIKMFYY